MAQANVQGCASSEHKGLEPAQRHHGLPFDPGPVLLLQLQRRQPQHRPNPVISAFQVLRILWVCLGGGSDLQGTKMNTKGRVLWVCCPALTSYMWPELVWRQMPSSTGSLGPGEWYTPDSHWNQQHITFRGTPFKGTPVFWKPMTCNVRFHPFPVQEVLQVARVNWLGVVIGNRAAEAEDLVLRAG